MGADLAALLAEERRRILAGDWAGLEALGPRKAAALESLGAAPPAALAPALARDLARNQALLAAAIEGFRDALRRRAALRGAASALVTYDARGGRAELPTARLRVERRA